MEQHVECCAMQLEYEFFNIYVLVIYRAPTDFEQFLNKLDCIINYLYKTKDEFIICGDINTYFLTERDCK
jgi:hypothetical protein